MNGSGKRVRNAARPRGLLWSLALAATAVALAACSDGDEGAGATRSGASEAGASGDNGLRVSLYQGEEVIGESDFAFAELLTRGQPVVLNFWAGLCPPCRAEMPSFQAVYEENAGEFILIGVDVGPFVGLGSTEDGTRLLREVGVTYPAGQALSPQVARQFSILSMPTTLFYDASGREVSRHSGFLTEGQLRDEIEKLLSARP